MKVTAIFDIGKTNKKFFLFDKNYQEVFRDYAEFEPIFDEDGVECENLQSVESWMKRIYKQVQENPDFNIKRLNFSSYGASFVHIGFDGKPVTPLYNYLKPCPKHVLKSFHDTYGSKLSLARETASPPLGFLNSGLQLYWLKHEKPEIYEKIRWSLHLPQYLSFLFTGNMVSDYTSIGCHTLLWNFDEQDYHSWVYQEKLHHKLPTVVNTDSTYLKELAGKKVKIGVGIHDSSSALLPYIRAQRKPFLLVSTGTWSISLNGFSEDSLSYEDLENDCLNFMRINGMPVRACRLFLGKEYRQQVHHLHRHFNLEYGYHRDVAFDHEIYTTQKNHYQRHFKLEHITISRKQPSSTNLDGLDTFEQALHQLILELVEMQSLCIKRAIGTTKINKIYIDGGFADNRLYVQMLVDHFPGFKLRTTKSPLGSALGAAIVITQPDLNKKVS